MMGSSEHDMEPGSGQIPRAHSNLEILSRTAAVIEESISSAQSSPYASARVTPADYTANGSPFAEQPSRKTFLALPEMPGRSQQLQENRTIYLEQKKGFLPPPLPFETGAVMVGSGIHIDSGGRESPPEYSPSIYWTYSNCNGGSSTTLMMRGPLSPVPAPVEQHQQQRMASITNGSDSASQRSATPTVNGSNDLVAHSYLGSVNSFSSGSAGSSGGNNSSQGLLAAPLSVSTSFGPTQSTLQHSHHGSGNSPSNKLNPTSPVSRDDDLVRENQMLRQQLAIRESTIDALQTQVESLQHEIRQLRQLPTGKISQIPVEDMISIMREYGSEVSDTAMPPRKSMVQKASVIRQFRRWNPNFLEWFEHSNGKWVPKLGKAGEMRRRQEARRTTAAQRKKKSAGGSEIDSFNASEGGEDESSNSSYQPADVISEESTGSNPLANSTASGLSL